MPALLLGGGRRLPALRPAAARADRRGAAGRGAERRGGAAGAGADRAQPARRRLGAGDAGAGAGRRRLAGLHADARRADRAARDRRGSTSPTPGSRARRITSLLLTATGVGFEHTIDVALATPDVRGADAGRARPWSGCCSASRRWRSGCWPIRRCGGRAGRAALPAGADRRAAGLPDDRHARRGAGARRRGARPAARRDAGLGRRALHRRRAARPRPARRRGAARARRSPASSRSASGCTISARAWSSAPRSPPARRRSRPSWSSASSSTT